MSKKSKWKFDQTFQKYENALVNFFVELGQAKWHSEPISVISAHLFLHDRLTQKQLRNLTGYALSTISTSLNALFTSGLKKRRIPGTNKSEYYFGEIIQTTIRDILKEGIEQATKDILDLHEFLSIKLDQLEVLIEMGDLEAEFAHQRTQQLLKFAEIYNDLIKSHNRLGASK